MGEKRYKKGVTHRVSAGWRDAASEIKKIQKIEVGIVNQALLFDEVVKHYPCELETFKDFLKPRREPNGVDLLFNCLAKVFAAKWPEPLERPAKEKEYRLRLYAAYGHHHRADDRILTQQRDYLKRVFEWHRNPKNIGRVRSAARGYYSGLEKLLDFPALTKSEWLTKRPISLDQIDRQLTWVPDEPLPALDENQLVLGETYSDFVSSIAPEVKQDNLVCYRPLEVSSSADRVHLSFSAERYQDYVNTMVSTFELGLWCYENPSEPKPPVGALKARGEPEAVFDFRNRSLALGICTFLLIRLREGDFFYLQRRTSPRLMQTAGGYCLMPAGSFQPDTAEDDNHERDFSLRRSVLREFAEELMGVEEVQKTIRSSGNFYDDPRLEPYLRGLKDGVVRDYYMGISVDPVLTAPDAMIAVIIDANHLDEASIAAIKKWPGNWEGEIHDAPLRNLAQWSQRETLAPTSATCLRLVEKHLDVLLQR